MWMQTSSKHGDQCTKRCTNREKINKTLPNVLAAPAVRQRSEVFITIDVRIYNEKWWLNLLQSVLLKIELLSPSCCTRFSRTGKTMMINAVSTGIFLGGKEGSFCWSHSLILQRYQIFTVEQRWRITASELKIVSHSSMRALQCRSWWIKLMPVCSEYCDAVFQPQLSTWTITSLINIIELVYHHMEAKITSLMVFMGVLFWWFWFLFVLNKEGNTVTCCDSYSLFLRLLDDYFDVCAPQGSCSCWRCSAL